MSEIKCTCKIMSGQIRHECNDTSYYALFANGVYVGDIYDEGKIHHIVKCVNEHDSIVAEVERLKQENEKLEREHTDDCEYVRLINK